jgi:hypothetical protein
MILGDKKFTLFHWTSLEMYIMGTESKHLKCRPWAEPQLNPSQAGLFAQ